MTENRVLEQGATENSSTEIQEVAGGPVALLPTRFDYSDVVFPLDRISKAIPASRQMQGAPRAAIYVIGSTPYVKIGWALDPWKRLNSIAVANPHDVRLFAVYWVHEVLATAAEAYCHEKLAPYHHRGEWFTCSRKIATHVVRSVCLRAAKARGEPLDSENISLDGDLSSLVGRTSPRLLERLRA